MQGYEGVKPRNGCVEPERIHRRRSVNLGSQSGVRGRDRQRAALTVHIQACGPNLPGLSRSIVVLKEDLPALLVGKLRIRSLQLAVQYGRDAVGEPVDSGRNNVHAELTRGDADRIVLVDIDDFDDCGAFDNTKAHALEFHTV